MILVLLISLLCLYETRTECALNMVFFIPCLVYGYYLSGFSDHFPPPETLHYSLWWVSGGAVYLVFFSGKSRKIILYGILSLLTLIYHTLQTLPEGESLFSDPFPVARPFFLFVLIFSAFWFFRKFYENQLKETQNTLNEQKQYIDEATKKIGQPILLIDAETDEEGQVTERKITYSNPAFEQAFSIRSREICGHPVTQVFPYLFRDTVDTNQLFSSTPTSFQEIFLEHLETWYEIHVLSLEKNRFICIFYDTTNLNQLINHLRDSRQRFKVLLEAIPDIFFVIDKDGIYEDFAMKDIEKLKINSTEIIGNSIYEVGFSEKMANKIYQCIQDAIANDSIESIEYALDTPNGTFIFEMRLAKLSDHSVISIARDITRRKTTEFKLEEALKKAEDATKLKSVFLANLSHEIRTPMNAIIGSSEILADPGLPVKEKKIYCNAILSNSRELMKMIDDTINLSKIETQTVDVTFAFCEVNATLKELLSIFKSIQEKEVEIDMVIAVNHPHFGFETDRYLLTESLNKLIDNALKFTHSGWIKFGYHMKCPGEVEFFVEDTGVGISPEHQERIFSRYYKINAINTADNRGAGLGLSIAREFVRLLGGQLIVESAPGKGSRFHFSLPFKNGQGYMKVVK
jgi:PAS domain S-box-containing protein